MKQSLLTGFRALAFALGVFMLIVVGGVTIRSARDVTLFVIGLAAFWVLVEKLFLTLRVRRKASRAGQRANRTAA